MPRRVLAKAKGKQAVNGGVYDDLIAEATSGSDFHSHDERPLKRRKAEGSKIAKSTLARKKAEIAGASSGKRDSPKQAPSSDDELAFEDVEIYDQSAMDLDSDEDIEDVNISVGQANTTPSKRQQAPRLEKSLRVLGHKAHLVALLGHCMIVNSRCNDRRVQRAMKSTISATTRSYLRPSKDHTQFQQDRTFNMGLQRAVDAYKDAFTVNAPGMKRAYWAEGEPVLPEGDAMDRKDFINAARQMQGSQDTGNQLFCAMLRAIGVQTRLVCSLQVLPLAYTVAPRTPTRVPKPVVFAIASDSPPTTEVNLTIKERAIRSARSRLGQPAFNRTSVTPPRTKSYHKTAFPIFWVEVLNPAYQKWIPVDPISTQTIGKANRLEPPLSYNPGQLTYAIAFSKGGSAKDVTRRYAKAYNAKTRRTRLECLGDIEALWLRKVFRMFAKQQQSDVDVLEETELSQRVGREGLPSNIQDFKGHPVYALERHLKRHEVLHPRREVGKINAGTAANPKMETIFRREDVHTCRSADQWYRHGRVVKPGEQALKLVPGRQRDDEDVEAVAMYTLGQTELYIPKPVIRGKVPRNAFGTLDLYVPSMIPSGGAHLRHPLAKNAANILGVDAVDAVTGFKFSGRKGTTVVEGVVVAEQYLDALNATIDALLWQEEDDRSRARSALAMRMWKRFLQGLRIAARVATYATEPMDIVEDEEPTASSAWYAEEVVLHTAGQYSLEELVSLATPKKVSKKRRIVTEDDTEMTDDALDDHEASTDWSPAEIGGRLPATTLNNESRGSVLADEGGGFIPDEVQDDLDRHDNAGGFIPDEEQNDHDQRNETGGFIPDEVQDNDHDQSMEAGGFIQVQDNDLDQIDEAGGLIHVQDHVDQTDNAGGFTSGSHNHIDLTDTKSEADLVRSVKSRTTSEDDIMHTQPPDNLQPIGRYGQRPGKIVASDAESLLSHDPEDDDAEPDWLGSE